MHAHAASHEPLPPRRTRLQRSLDRLESEIDERRARDKRFVDLIRMVLAERYVCGRADAQVLLDPITREIACAVELEAEEGVRREWCAMLVAVFGVAGPEWLMGKCRRARNLRALRAMFLRRADWRRQPGDWAPDMRLDEASALASLARHLFVEWEMPAFMDHVWPDPGSRAKMKRDLYVHMAAGRSLRGARLPYRLTRRQAHEFGGAPDDFNVEQALVRADALSLGGTEETALALARTPLWEGLLLAPVRRAYWLSVVRYIIANPELAGRRAGVIVDYLRARIEAGVRKGLNLHGRRPGDVWNEVRDWHRFLHSYRLKPDDALRSFPAPDIRGFETDGLDDGQGGGRARFRIKRIGNPVELLEEGAAMAHCVFTYVVRCRTGANTIWSMTREVEEGVARRVLTIRLCGRQVVEIGGLANRAARDDELALVRKWCEKEGLTLRA